MPDQTISFSIGGREDFISPESVADVLSSIVETLKSVDSNMWKIGHPRFKWRIAKASFESPLTISLSAELSIPDAPIVDVVRSVMDGWRSLADKPESKPAYFDDDDLKRARTIGSIFNNAVVSLRIQAPGQQDIAATTEIAKNVDRLLGKTKAKSSSEYGSLEGVLRQVTVDDREDHQRSEFQIIVRDTTDLVSCRFNPQDTADVGGHIRSRIVVFGDIRYSPAAKPTHIDVSRYRIIQPDDQLPPLDEIQSLGLRTEDDVDSVEAIRRIRGE